MLMCHVALGRTTGRYKSQHDSSTYNIIIQSDKTIRRYREMSVPNKHLCTTGYINFITVATVDRDNGTVVHATCMYKNFRREKSSTKKLMFNVRGALCKLIYLS